MLGNEERKQRPQDKWDEKAGLVPKTYKINKKVAETVLSPRPTFNY